MGVSGSGKTTVGRLLAAELRWRFYEGDDFHPAANFEKMRRGVPLNDADRKPWLNQIAGLICNLLGRNESGIIACSALKKAYRDYLLVDERVNLIYLKGEFHLFQERIQKRSGHFMPPDLLRSQFKTLEEPQDALVVDASLSPRAIVTAIVERLERGDPGARF